MIKDAPTINHMRAKQKWTKEEEALLLKVLPEKKVYKDLLKYFPNRSWESIKGKFKQKKLQPKRKIYYKNEQFFEVPNLINSYWSGMILSDGYLFRGNGDSLHLSLQIKDKNHVQWFANDAGSNIKAKDWIKPNKPRFSRVSFYGATKWMEDLNKNWNIPLKNKSFTTIGPPIYLSVENALAELKGQLDGDGSLAVHKDKKKRKDGTDYERMILTFLGTKDIVLWNKIFLEKFIFKRYLTVNIHPDKSIFKLTLGNNDAVILYNIFKSIKTPELHRKWTNPELLEYIEKMKIKKPELFNFTLTQEELLAPNNIIIPENTEILPQKV